MLGLSTATILGYLLAKSPMLERLAGPYIVASQSIPSIAIAPLLIIWFGSGKLSKVLICALVVFFPVLVNTIVGIRSVDDIKGTKIAHTGSSGDVLAALGGNMVNMPIYDVYQAMETGLVDCSVTYAYYAVASKLSEEIDTMTELRYSTITSLGTVMNRDSFERLTPEQQEAILGIGPDMMNFYGEKLEEADLKALEVLSSGDDPVEFVKLSDEGYDAMDVAGVPMFDNWYADTDAVGTDGKALLAELYALMDKWTVVMETEGLPWHKK